MKFASNMTQLPGALFTSGEEQFLQSFATVLTHRPVWRQKFLSLLIPSEEAPTVEESKPPKKKRSRPPVDKKPTVKRPRKKKQAPEQIVAPDQESALKSLENWMAEQVGDEPKPTQVADEAPTPSELTITDAGKEGEIIIPAHVCPYFDCAYPMCVIDWSGH